ncbi:glycosyltransferase [Pararhizobium arenae]|uniref:glycosyltransferase n=1 Tax=Pararhizobium arenae TaxID=1856850 RepID=UPI00094ABF8E|nr:glycosyltransferase [Pararhizobium arenae]
MNEITPIQTKDLQSLQVVETSLVQRLLTPEPGINSEYPLFYHHGDGQAGYDTLRKAYFVQRGARISFNSYFNAFPAHLYDLKDREVTVEIRATGEFYLQFVMARHGRSWEHLYNSKVELGEGESEFVRLPTLPFDGLVYAEIIAVRDTVIHGIDYNIVGKPNKDVTLTAVITTFKRNDAVQTTGKRIQAYFDANPDLLPRFQLLVIDNGGDTDSIPFSKGRVIKNKNLGGAGGFTRGLMEVTDNQLSSHVLFMDDDASFFPESLRRTISVLQFSASENLAVSGAMITESQKWRMWENGATFDRSCRPIDNGRDLRNFHEVVAMSVGQPRHSKNKYAGWWYFCFPVSSVKVWPFPFFVRGDDSYFSLSNDFDIITMPGVASHQEDFFTKQSPLTLYLDMRYHIVHHLTFDDLEIGKRNIRKMAERYFNRFNNSYHYESAQAVNLAIEDVLAGDAFWEQNVDMAEKRKKIAGMTIREKVQDGVSIDITRLTKHSPRRNKGPWMSFWRSVTFNGHILPEKLFYKRAVLYPLDVRAIEHDTFLRPYSVTLDPSTGKGYTCKIDKKLYFENRKQFLALAKRLESEYENLRKRYTGASSTMTAKDAWKRRFGMTA